MSMWLTSSWQWKGSCKESVTGFLARKAWLCETNSRMNLSYKQKGRFSPFLDCKFSCDDRWIVQLCNSRRTPRTPSCRTVVLHAKDINSLAVVRWDEVFCKKAKLGGNVSVLLLKLVRFSSLSCDSKLSRHRLSSFRSPSDSDAPATSTWAAMTISLCEGYGRLSLYHGASLDSIEFYQSRVHSQKLLLHQNQAVFWHRTNVERWLGLSKMIKIVVSWVDYSIYLGGLWGQRPEFELKASTHRHEKWQYFFKTWVIFTIFAEESLLLVDH